jgi:hypothetical protein
LAVVGAKKEQQINFFGLRLGSSSLKKALGNSAKELDTSIKKEN